MYSKYEEEKPPVGIIILLVIGIIILPFAVWGAKVALAPVFGHGNAVIKKNDATNRIDKQELFEQMYATIIADDGKIGVANDAYNRDKSYTNEVNLNGLTQHCIQAVADYNAEARKYSSEDFRTADVPFQIDPLDPTTDCKPNN